MSHTVVSIEAIKKLRETMGVGMQEAKQALDEAGGDSAKARDILRTRGSLKAAKKSSRAAGDGLIGSYLHGGRVGVLVEVNCETDFVAKTEDFKQLVHELALQIAGAAPRYVSRQQVPAAVIEHERMIIRQQLEGQNKPREIFDKIVVGKLERFFEEVCLLEQPSIKDGKVKVGQLVTDAIARLGENIVVRRFVRFQLGEEDDAAFSRSEVK